jgi:GNAT superfamily N-acetyltransferase
MSTASEECLFVDYFENLSKDVQIDACSHLFEAFLDDFIEDEIFSVQELIDRIRDMFSGVNVFLVFFNGDREIIGMASCDMTYYTYTPCIGNLCVVEKFRNRGYAEDILDFMYVYLKRKSGYEYAYLWCYPFLLEYYKKRGWMTHTVKRSNTKGEYYIMKHRLVDR